MDSMEMFNAIQNGIMDYTGFKEWFDSEINEADKGGYDNGFDEGLSHSESD